MDTDEWMESEEFLDSDEFMATTCGNLNRKARQGTLTVEDIDQAIQRWGRCYKAYHWIISACIIKGDGVLNYLHMKDICQTMTPESVKSVVIPPFLMGDDPFKSVLRDLFVRSCYHAAFRLWIPPPPTKGVIVYGGIDYSSGQAYSNFIVVKRRPDDTTDEGGSWYLYEVHDWYNRSPRLRRREDGFDGYLARCNTLAAVLDRCGDTNQNSCRDLQICLCKYVESKYYVLNNDLEYCKAKYRVVLSSLPDDHQAAIAYVITRTRTNYKFRGLPAPIGIYDVKSLDTALQNWVASTMREKGIDNIYGPTFQSITHFNDRTFDDCLMGINPFFKSHEHAAMLIQRRWRQIRFNPNCGVGCKSIKAMLKWV